MNLLLIAPNTEQIPPYEGYGGTERVIYDLALEAAEKDHKVDVVCKAGSTIEHPNIEVISYSGQTQAEVLEFLCSYLRENADRYDVVNLHIFKLNYVRKLSRVFEPLITSIHFYIDAERIRPFRETDSYFLVQSLSQEKFYKKYLGNKVKGVLQGIRMDHIPCSSQLFSEADESSLKLKFHQQLRKSGVKNYLLILSKISRRKGQLTAIRLSKDLGIPIVIAGEPKDDDEDAREHSIKYFEHEIKPLIDEKQVFYFGNASEQEKYELMRYARAFILPTGFEDEWWREAFGRVVAESLATGTPVVAHRNGAMEEQIVDGKNGFLFSTYDEAIEQLKSVDSISGEFCREDALNRLDSKRFAKECLDHFTNLTAREVIYGEDSGQT